VAHPPVKQVVAVGPHKHPVFVMAVHEVVGANKYPDEQAKQRFEILVVEITLADKLAERPAEAAQEAQLVLAVLHVPTWAKA